MMVGIVLGAGLLIGALIGFVVPHAHRLTPPSARPTTTRRSKRPGRSSAGSRISGRLVAAMIMTFVSVSKPSISTSI